jgi:transposase-like protein
MTEDLAQKLDVEELKKRFSVRTVPPYGQCIVIPGSEFDPDWEVYLDDQGYRCFMTTLDGSPMTLVRLSKKESEKTQDALPMIDDAEVPLKEKEPCPYCGSENIVLHGMRYGVDKSKQRAFCKDCQKHFTVGHKAELERKEEIIKYAKELSSRMSLRDIAKEVETKFGVKVSHVAIKEWIGPLNESHERGASWTDSEDTLIIQLWNQGFTKDQIAEKLPNRSVKAVKSHLQRLREAKRIKKRGHVGRPRKAQVTEAKPEPPGVKDKESKQTKESTENLQVGSEPTPERGSATQRLIETVDKLVDIVDKLSCQALMHSLEIRELKAQDGFKIPLALWVHFTNALMNDDKKYRDLFRDKVSKLLEASA